jgi:Subtilisin-like serine proteases
MHRKPKQTLWSAAWGSLTLAALLLAPSTAGCQSSKLSPDLRSLASGTAVNVIVQYYNPPTSADTNYAKSLGASLGKGLGFISGYGFSNMSPTAAAKLVNLDANIKYISLDRKLQLATTMSSDSVMNVTVGANWARSMGYDGTGVGVAVIDSGVDAVPDLGVPGSNKSRIVYNANFDTSTTTSTDLYGHGTHVAGIITGNGASSNCSNCTITYRGVAPNANIINLRALDANGQATDSEVIAAIQTAISLKGQYNIRVINLSLGRGICESYTLDPLDQAVEQAWRAGIVVVVAAGNYGRDNSNNNDGYGTITSPGNDPYVITVGAMRDMGTYRTTDDVIATYSSKGPTMDDQVVKPDLVAPANLIVSDLASSSDKLYSSYPQNLVPLSTYTQGNNVNISQQYYLLSGTSMATPVVSGAAILLIQQNPAMTPDQVKARLMLTASKTFPAYSSWTDPATGITYNEQYDIFTVGAGYANVYNALTSSALAPSNLGAALSPSVAYNSTTGQVYLVDGSSVVWGSSVIWGTSVVWGTSVIWGTNTSGQSVVWGSSVVWGTSSDSGFSSIWGSSVVWGASSSDAMAIAINGEQ